MTVLTVDGLNLDMHCARSAGAVMPLKRAAKPARPGSLCPERTRAYLRALYPANTCKSVARDLNVSQKTVENWINGGAPGVSGVVRLVCVYGTDFILACFIPPPTWIDVAKRAEDIEAVLASVRQLNDRVALLQTGKRS